MKTRVYKVSDLRRIIKESTNEFKPVMGKNVESDNKKINDKAYNDISKEVKSYDGGARNEKKVHEVPQDDNKGMQDLEYENATPDFKKRVKAQMKGYVNADAEKKHKNDEYGNAEFNVISGMEEKNKYFRDGKFKAKTSGLTSKTLDKEKIDKQSDSVFENKVVRLKFKNTTFITENHMINKIPDDYKVNGRKFIMQDKNNNEYLVEWNNDNALILNTSKINEEQKRIKELFSYKRGESNTTNKLRLSEDNKINDILGKARLLSK